ncbi:hypothetical protein [Sphingobacterium corticibacter]|uniref:Uncharacterized protein n=1 Tax=Sphingobacterium corticibacter TaxID=2171749 RepID=A0A2T8HFV1_9SPHI|nr:hypothetical protein [Sphingobacterium corticibacter]PVH24283.1 hypothetical protein DC487_14450 [Sphingobacterium corticibacter]
MNWINQIEPKFIMNVPLKEGDPFLKKQLYKYKFTGKPKVATIIELEYYDCNIVVMSFYTDGTGTDKTRYKVRHNYSPIIVLRIFQACLKIFLQLNIKSDHTLVFNAANDIGDHTPFNKRMSSYVTFLEYYYPNFTDDCSYYGYMQLNTFYLHNKTNPNADEAKSFFNWYCDVVMEQLNNEESDPK